MSSPLYSTNLLALRDFSGNEAVPAPPGTVLVIRDIDVYYGGLLAPQFNASGDAGQVFASNTWAPASPGLYSWRGRYVTRPSGLISVFAEFGMDISVSGYVLSAP